VIDRVAGETHDICAADCDRIATPEPTTLVNAGELIETYWGRLDPSGATATPDETRHFLLERHDGPCKVGYQLDREHSCPLFDLDLNVSNVRDFLTIVERVSEFRFAQARDCAAEKAQEEAVKAATHK